MKDEIITIETLTADDMMSVVGGDMRTVATAWEARATDTGS